MAKKSNMIGNMTLTKYQASVDSILYNDMIDNNYYSQLLFELFETTYLPEYETVQTWKRHFGKPFKVNIKQYEAIEKINKKINILRTESPSFDDMFEFGTFIKILEKVYMYKNDKDANFVCDSNLDDTKHRVLVIQNSNHFIRFSLEKHSGGTPNTIDIMIERLYGKNMKTMYHIENRNSNAKDSSDIMLINNITMLLKDKMANLLAIYGNVVVNKLINYAIENGVSEFEKCKEKSIVQNMSEYDPLSLQKSDWYKDLEWYLKHVYK